MQNIFSQVRTLSLPKSIKSKVLFVIFICHPSFNEGSSCYLGDNPMRLVMVTVEMRKMELNARSFSFLTPCVFGRVVHSFTKTLKKESNLFSSLFLYHEINAYDTLMTYGLFRVWRYRERERSAGICFWTAADPETNE